MVQCDVLVSSSPRPRKERLGTYSQKRKTNYKVVAKYCINILRVIIRKEYLNFKILKIENIFSEVFFFQKY